MKRPPVIAISPNALPAEDRPLYKNKALEYGEASMARVVRAGGAVPLMAYRADVADAEALAAHAEAVIGACDGLVLSGGADVDPPTYGDVLHDERWRGDPLRDAFEIALYRAARAADKPVLGVCRGAQLINVAEGGTLWQDLRTLREGSLVHRDQEAYDRLGHPLELDVDTRLAPLFEGEPLHVNSVHHQGVRELAPDARVLARAPDGVVEAFEISAAAWILAVQWHPEWMVTRSSARLFQALARAAGGS